MRRWLPDFTRGPNYGLGFLWLGVLLQVLGLVLLLCE